MELTYEWSIIGLKKQNTNTLSDAIIEVDWILKGIDVDGIYGQYKGKQFFDITEIGNGFISYSDLTEEIIIQWIKDIVWVNLDSSEYTYVDSIIGSIEHEIQQKKYNVSFVSSSQMPWVPEPEPEQFIEVEMQLPDSGSIDN